MLESTQPKDKKEFEEFIDATVLARKVLLRTHGFSPYQHVLGRDPELAFDVLVPGADMAAVTILVLDRPSERVTQIHQAARQAFVESQDDKATRRALVARPRPWREFQVGDQVAFWRKRQRSRHETWSCSLARASSGAGIMSWLQECMGGKQTSVTAWHDHGEGCR